MLKTWYEKIKQEPRWRTFLADWMNYPGPPRWDTSKEDVEESEEAEEEEFDFDKLGD
jgi:hypothetical protein